jgi:hypothetical protein
LNALKTVESAGAGGTPSAPVIEGITEELGAVYTVVTSNVLAAGLNQDSSPDSLVAFVRRDAVGLSVQAESS